MGKILYWINLENYSFKLSRTYLFHTLPITDFIRNCSVFFYIDVCCDFTRKTAWCSRTDVNGNGSIREILTRKISREIEVSQSGFIHFDEFWRFSNELMICFLSLPPIIENHFLLVHLSRCRQAQLLLNPHCCNWAWGFPGTKYKQKEKLVPG